MEIMKVFSDSYDEDRIYSVLLDEEELYLFSEIQKEFTGAVKAANKALKNKWVKSLGTGSIESGRNVLQDNILQTGSRVNLTSVPLEVRGGRIISHFEGRPSLENRNVHQRINMKGGIEEPYIRKNPIYRFDHRWERTGVPRLRSVKPGIAYSPERMKNDYLLSEAGGDMKRIKNIQKRLE